ncbi:hypothetical protein E2C01_018926 [Portunus trituberculatus]|uniref:Uncharacterized protein n=1 Tax=Portunus trituberculatus TaxID=210409 RepID=A0A5B7DXW5_PORTR|nr:hypothetical protein [Portunus trituberculatus]
MDGLSGCLSVSRPSIQALHVPPPTILVDARIESALRCRFHFLSHSPCLWVCLRYLWDARQLAKISPSPPHPPLPLLFRPYSETPSFLNTTIFQGQKDN